MNLKIFYFDGEIKRMTIDHTEWSKAPNTILSVMYENHNGATQELFGYGAYYVIDDYIGGFNPINGINLNTGISKQFPVEQFVVDTRVKMGKEVSNKQWSEFHE